MAVELASPSGEVVITIPGFLGGTWAVDVRGQRFASGFTWPWSRNATDLFDSLEAVAETCEGTPGYGEAGAELRRIILTAHDGGGD